MSKGGNRREGWCYTQRRKCKQSGVELEHEPSFLLRLIQRIPKVVIPLVRLCLNILIRMVGGSHWDNIS